MKENEYITILSEECSEIIQVACKILRFGKHSRNPLNENSESNIELLQNELGDLLAIIEILSSELKYIDSSKVEIAKQNKLLKVKKWVSGGEGWKEAIKIHTGVLNDRSNV